MNSAALLPLGIFDSNYVNNLCNAFCEDFSSKRYCSEDFVTTFIAYNPLS
jgi:hypothetical protein